MIIKTSYTEVANSSERSGSAQLTTEGLRERWRELSDLEKAEALVVLLNATSSIRQLARAIEKPESSLRYLLHLSEATPKEKETLRECKSTTRKTVLAIRARRSLKIEKTEGQLGRVYGKHDEAARQITEWLHDVNLIEPDRERILRECRKIFADKTAQAAETFRQNLLPNRLGEAASLTQPRSVPKEPIEAINVRARMLAVWLLCRYADPKDSIRALNLALDIHKAAASAKQSPKA